MSNMDALAYTRSRTPPRSAKGLWELVRTVRCAGARRFLVMSARLCLAAALLSSLSVVAFGQDVFTDSIVVRGEAVSNVAPDAVVWVVGLEREAADRDGARTALDAETTQVREVAAAAGLLESDITVARMMVRGGDGHYVARRTITLSQQATGGAITLMHQLNALRPAELTYRLDHSKRKDLEHETQQQAVANARSQASAVAQSLGTTLGRVIVVENEFGEAGAFGLRPRFSTYETMPLEHVTAETFAQAKIRVHASVYVTYSLGAAVAAG